LIHTWREEQGEKATLNCMVKCLDKADLKGTKYRWWNDYRGKQAFKFFTGTQLPICISPVICLYLVLAYHPLTASMTECRM